MHGVPLIKRKFFLKSSGSVNFLWYDYKVNYLVVVAAGETSDVPLSIERLVAWLLEHPDAGMSDSDTISSFDALSDSDSTSEDAEEVSSSFTHVVRMPSVWRGVRSGLINRQSTKTNSWHDMRLTTQPDKGCRRSGVYYPCSSGTNLRRYLYLHRFPSGEDGREGNVRHTFDVLFNFVVFTNL